eukprot:gene25339-biopygen13511
MPSGPTNKKCTSRAGEQGAAPSHQWGDPPPCPTHPGRAGTQLHSFPLAGCAATRGWEEVQPQLLSGAGPNVFMKDAFAKSCALDGHHFSLSTDNVRQRARVDPGSLMPGRRRRTPKTPRNPREFGVRRLWPGGVHGGPGMVQYVFGKIGIRSFQRGAGPCPARNMNTDRPEPANPRSRGSPTLYSLGVRRPSRLQGSGSLMPRRRRRMECPEGTVKTLKKEPRASL